MSLSIETIAISENFVVPVEMGSNQESDDYYTNRFLPCALNKLYLDSQTADVNFIFVKKEKSKRVPAHKNILSISEVFKQMFYGKMKEGDEVKIIDASPDGFKEFLRFFYFDKINLTMANIKEVVNLCNKYIGDSCLNICAEFLTNSLNTENVCFVYGLAILYDLNELKKSCETMIAEDTESVWQSTSFMECDQTVLEHILRMDRLSCAETSVFYACMAWVKAKSNQIKVTSMAVEQHLGYLFYKIRFRSMTIEGFTSLLSTFGDVFSTEEYREVIQMIVSHEFHSTIFDTRLRQLQWNNDAVVTCHRTKETESGSGSVYYMQDVEMTSFTSNLPILLGQIVCAQLYDNEKLPTEITIIEYLNKKLPKIVAHLTGDLLNIGGHTIFLKSTILIKADVKYEIEFKQLPRNNRFYSKTPVTEAKIPETDVTIEFKDCATSRGSASLITALAFNLISE